MNLKEFFESTGVKQTYIALKANISPACVLKAVRGADVKLSTAIKICEATQGRVTPKDLYNSLIRNDDVNKAEKHENKHKATQRKNSKVGIS
jgi:hypothetical protein